MTRERIIQAAGGVVWRKRTSPSGSAASIEVLVIHRPKYDDWTLPKGKIESGESLRETAVREIAEETGLRVRLGIPLQQVEYRVAAGLKRVDYWSARPVGPSGTERFEANNEVDEVRWVKLGGPPKSGAAPVHDLLTYPHDREVLERFRDAREAKRHKSRTLIIARHASAKGRNGFDGPDTDRPLDETGLSTATALAPLLATYGIRHVVSSPALRCTQTLEPYAHSVSTFIEIDDRLYEDAKPALLRRSVTALLERKKPTVVCTHRQTLPAIFEDLGIDPVALQPGESLVVHHRKGSVCGVEHIPIRTC